MILVVILAAILASIGDPTAAHLMAWFGQHLFLTILMVLFLG